MAKSMGPGNPLFDDPVAFLFTDGSALPTGSAGWGVHITFPGGADTRAIWGPVSTSPSGSDWLGARRATSNTGELSALYHTLDWIQKRRKHLDPAPSPCYNIVTDSYYCVKLFATRAIKPVANKHIISRINILLDQENVTTAHTNSADPLAQRNAEAGRLAARGCVTPHLMTQRRPSAPPSWHQPAVPPRPGTRPPVRSRTSDILCVAVRGAAPSHGGIRVSHPSTHANPRPGVLFSVA